MAEIINLRRARKGRERAEASARAAENRARHGRSKSERLAADATREQLDRALDGARRDDPQD